MSFNISDIKLSVRNTPFSKPIIFIYRKIKIVWLSTIVQKILIKIRYITSDILDLFNISHSINTPLTRQMKKIIRRTSNIVNSQLKTISENDPKILIATSYGFTPYMLGVESTIAVSLKLRGKQPYILACEKSLPACEWNRWGNEKPDTGKFPPTILWEKGTSNCDYCVNGFYSIIGQLPFPIISFSKYFDEVNEEELIHIIDEVPYNEYYSFKYKGINVGHEAYSSTVRSLQIGVLDDDEETRWIFKRYLLSGLWVVELFERVINDLKPEAIFSVHGVYITHGILAQIARKRNINLVVWSGPDPGNKIKIEKNYAPVIGIRNRIKNSDLSPINVKKRNFILSSIKKRRDDASPFHGVANPIKSKDEIVNSLELDIEKPIISLFTNVTADSAHWYPSKLFNNILDWVFYTIDYFLDYPELQLIIRSHPSERSGIGSRQPVANEINKKYKSLPQNIKLISPESRFSSYSILDMTNVALIYASTVGLEATIMGIPTILIANASYSSDFTFNPTSKGEYNKLLNNLFDLKVDKKMQDQAINAAYEIWFESQIKFDLVGIKNHVDSDGLKLNYRKYDDLFSGNDMSLDTVCEKIYFGENIR